MYNYDNSIIQEKNITETITLQLKYRICMF